LMAMMMREPADVLMLDEPTNDLDIASIEVLERALNDFPGAVVVITHDRHLLDRICTDLIGLHGDGHWGAYASVAQWLDVSASAEKPSPSAGRASDRRRKAVPDSPRKGLTYHEKQEFAGMEEQILVAEQKVDALQTQLNGPDVADDHERLHATYEAHREAQQELDRLFARWEELEHKALGE